MAEPDPEGAAPPPPGETDRTADTRVMSGTDASLPAPTSMSRATPRSRTVVRASATPDALLRDEANRSRVLGRLMLGLGLASLAMLPVVELDRIGRATLAVSMCFLVLAYSCVLWLTNKPGRFTVFRMGLVAQISCLSADLGNYAFGPFSPVPMATAVPLAAYALGASYGWSLAAYVHAAAGHLVVVLLIRYGVIGDHGMLPSSALSPMNQNIAEVCVQSMFLLAFVLGRLARAHTERTVGELEQAVRQVAERDALLAELHHQVDVAAGLGTPGRFTDHVIGSFRLGVVLGRGGMGEVYEATHTGTGALAAVKLLARGALSDPGKVARFVRELEIARSINAPNLVRVLEVGDPSADLPYLAMERLVGHDLADVLRARPRLELAETVELVRQVAAGLAPAHAAGIVHRDLKPSNVFRTGATGALPVWKVLDFGVSKLATGTGDLTRDVVVGTPAYMAPEQARGQETDARADVYALAAIAYRALTGRALFASSDVPELLYKVVHTMPVRPGTYATLPNDVDAVLALGLAKEPADRLASAAELAEALAAAARQELPDELRGRARRVLEKLPWST